LRSHNCREKTNRFCYTPGIADAAAIGKENVIRYICTQCGYIYDPKQGDPMNNIPAGTDFKDLPDTWVCPMCYATQDMFDPLD
jgi:rubredoxin